MQLTPNFTLDELTRTSYDIPNSPNKEQIARLKTLCERILEPVRIRFQRPVIITSGFRGTEVNMLVGGAPTSQHTKGEAADFYVRGVENQVVWKYIANNLLFDQCIAEKLSKKDGNKGWIHASYRENKNRKQELSYIKLNNKWAYVDGLYFID